MGFKLSLNGTPIELELIWILWSGKRLHFIWSIYIPKYVIKNNRTKRELRSEMEFHIWFHIFTFDFILFTFKILRKWRWRIKGNVLVDTARGKCTSVVIIQRWNMKIARNANILHFIFDFIYSHLISYYSHLKYY